MPALLVALAVAYRDHATRLVVGAVLLGAAVNTYGLWADAVDVIRGPTF